MPRVIILSNPRSGSTFFQELLNSHPEIEIAEELLNDEHGLMENPLKEIQKTLDSLDKTYVGFKAFPEQIFGHNLHFGDLLQSIGATHVVVVWREEILESLTSRMIAHSSGEWYSNQKATKLWQVEIDPEDLKTYGEQLKSEWTRIGKEWPVDVRPIFVKYEDLLRTPLEETKRALAEMSLGSEDVSFHTQAERQNPAPIEKKVTNYMELPVELREEKLDVQKILLDMINISLQIPNELLQYAPDREPCMPPGGWRYRVAEPYLPTIAKQNAFDAIQSGSISSAGYWPREMAKKLRRLFQCPVAQPCSNGFTALLLAMQAADIGEGDEVILPTMTMVAVPNSVYYLRATPVFADNANGSYNPSWAEYESVATDKTKAVVVTHTYGVPAENIEYIAEKCKARGWTLIEDISECVGVTCKTTTDENRLLGTFGQFAIASLYANKIIHGGDGGFVLAKEARIGKRLASIANHGFTPSFHFVHFEQSPNAKIHGIGAAIASGCLDEVKVIMEHRSFLAKLYREKLSGFPIKLMPKCGPQDTPWVFGIQCPSKSERTKLRAFLAKHGIETRDFFFNLHLQPAYLPAEGSPKSLPNAETLGSTGFYLPTHSNLTEVDVSYICDALKLYYSENSTNAPNSLAPVQKPPKCVPQIQPDGFALEVRRYRNSGELIGTTSRNHIYIEAVKLGFSIEETLFHERYDQVHQLLEQLKNLFIKAESEKDPLYKSMKKYFGTFIDYYESQVPLEQPCQRPWLTVDLSKDTFQASRSIPTTTDPETLQLLVHLLEQHRPETIWEIGSWLGHATTLISEVLSELNHNHRVFACDAFRWQAWMRYYLPEKYAIQDGKSFLETFQDNLGPFSKNVEPVQWPYDISELPIVLQNQKPNLVFLDITQEDEDLEHIWSLIKDNLIPDETIILFNGLAITSIPFFTRHAKELKAIAKPHTMAKSFLYVNPSVAEETSEDTYEQVQAMMRDILPLKRRLNFYSNPGWDHHHRNLFCRSIDQLKERMHSPNADIVFVPAVEETLCDDPDLFYENSWIGIIHAVAEHPELFYTPDLNRLCTHPRYIAAMKNCRALFTLTEFQAEYLKRNLPKSLPPFPIQTLTYPTEIIENSESSVPDLLKKGDNIQVLHVGSFARDFQFFFDISLPPNFQKVLVAGDQAVIDIAKDSPSDVTVVGRLKTEEYEEKLKNSILFLTLKYEGAANTLLLECIARNIPVLSPNMSSSSEYLGKEYPMFYDPVMKGDDLAGLLTLDNIIATIDYLKKMDKSNFHHEHFIKSVEKGAVMLSIPPSNLKSDSNTGSITDKLCPSTRDFTKFDVTICICSYKRTHHLPKLLESLWKNQDFEGSYQIIIWNNNDSRSNIVRDYSMKYIQSSSEKKSLEIISSTENYYCSIRFALPAIMKGDCLLICDDDIIPGQNFISFFHSNHRKNPQDVLCVRGHEFFPHSLNLQNPSQVWMEYDSLRFRNDDQPEQLIHFVHADACLIPKPALQEIASVSMPDPSFALVDDYWMSFILSHKFGRKLRKLSVAGLPQNPIVRTDDSDELGLALHTRPEVQDARLRLYVHHMINGWPKWESASSMDSPEVTQAVQVKKRQFWSLPPQIGFNISSTLSKEGIAELVETETKCVRIGAVGVGGKQFFELSGFLTEPKEQLKKLEETVGNLRDAKINVIITLERRLVSEETWKMIANTFATYENVVGYDLINEPFTPLERELHWAEAATKQDDTGLDELENNLISIIQSIRSVDKYTSIVLEPTFWGRLHGLAKFPIEKFLEIDSNIVFSFHFYEPMALTTRTRNKGRYTFPCSVPWYDNVKYSEETNWNEETILEKLKYVKDWAEEKGVRIILTEFGCCRDIGGAKEYLKAVMDSCKTLAMTGLLFSFRDPDWEAMDYELGPDITSFTKDKSNSLMRVVLDGISVMNQL